jgi:glutamate-1-semialdehyde 2,1-aminomutase
VLKFEGMYRVHNDDMLLYVLLPSGSLEGRRKPNKIPESVGVPETTFDSSRRFRGMTWSSSNMKHASEGDEITAVITEAVATNSGLLWPHDDYLQELQHLTDEHVVFLILHKVVTGFRMGLQSAQGGFDLNPDLAIYGKALPNGYSCPAFTRRAVIMDSVDSEPDGGTFMGRSPTIR